MSRKSLMRAILPLRQLPARYRSHNMTIAQTDGARAAFGHCVIVRDDQNRGFKTVM